MQRVGSRIVSVSEQGENCRDCMVYVEAVGVGESGCVVIEVCINP